MLLNDKEIMKLGEKMISPFVPLQTGKPSYGLGSFGYDIRLGYNFLVSKHDYKRHISPLGVSRKAFKKVSMRPEREFFVLYPGSCVLGESLEVFDIPRDIFVLAFGKSTYARLGVIPHVTPLEPGWKGKLTIEIANTGRIPVHLIMGQGIAQLIFFRGDEPSRDYTEKGGIYQNQEGITLP